MEFTEKEIQSKAKEIQDDLHLQIDKIRITKNIPYRDMVTAYFITRIAELELKIEKLTNQA